MEGIENNRMNYIHYNNPLLGTTLTDTNTTKQKIFNLYQSGYSYQFAKFVLNTVKYNIATTTMDEIVGLIEENPDILFLLNNDTGEIEIKSTTTDNVSIILDLKTGIMTSILCVNGFEYMGAITEEITPETENQTKQNMQKLPEKICFEDGLCLNFKDKTRNFFNIPLDSGWTEVEDMIGSALMDGGVIVFEAGLGTGGLGCLVGAGMFGVGVLVCADANGLLTDFTNINKAFDTGLDIGLNFLPSALLAKGGGNIFKLAVKKGKFLDDMGRTGKIVNVTFNTLRVFQNTVYGEARNKIVAPPIRNTILPYLNGTKSIGGWT